jgi:Cu/Zn superoxide dismutase
MPETIKTKHMKTTTKNTLLALALIASVQTFAGNLGNSLLLTAKMTGAQETPAVTTNALGVASFTLNATHDTMCVNVSFNGLSGNATGVHVHSGAPGVSGAVVTDLSPFISFNRISTSLTGSNLTPALVSAYLKGGLYINAHTTANPNGEIRGQIMLETDWSFASTINGAQETPAINTNAFGLGVFNLAQHGGTLQFHIVASGLSGAITGAHLHMGAMGIGGGVVVDLSTYVNGNVISGSIDTSSITNSAMFLNNLMMGNIYFNIHTAANPNGEIRGQLMADTKLAFDANLNGAQETPSVTTTADAIGSFKINTTFDTLWYHVVAAGLSGQMSGIHFHSGAVGVAGGVVADLSSGISGNLAMGTLTGANLTSALIKSLMNGSIYINIHTAANANGEIRGQVYRLAREGLVMSLDGMQETPAVTTNAKGSGIVSIDRNQTNAHFMYVCSGLSGTSSGVHFHSGAMGMSGGVIYDLTPKSMLSGANASGWGYLKSTDASPFTMANSMKMLGDSVYINLHTAANPNGEMRGQVLRGSVCFPGTTTGIEEKALPKSFAVYPNPSSGIVNVQIESSTSVPVQILVYDMLGKEVSAQMNKLNAGSNLLNLNISNLENGIYFIRIQSDKQVITQKIIKN